MTHADEISPSRSWLFVTIDMAEAVSLRVAGGEAVVLTQAGPTSDSENEDAAAVVSGSPASTLLAVADGFGGGPAGERASHLAISEVASGAERVPSDEKSLRASILDGFEAANRKILELGIGAATTLATVGIENGVVRPFHSGDSSILLLGGRGKIKWQSVAHSPAGYALASGWVGEREARDHEEAQVVSNYLGSTEMRIEIGPELRLAPRDTILVASDGLTDNLSLDEVSNELSGGRPLLEAVGALARRARRRMDSPRGKPDDLTLVAFRPRP